MSNQQRDFGRSGMEEVMVVAMGAAMEEDTVEVMAKGLALEQPVLSRSIFCSQGLFLLFLLSRTVLTVLTRSRPIHIYQTRNLKGFCSELLQNTTLCVFSHSLLLITKITMVSRVPIATATIASAKKATFPAAMVTATVIMNKNAFL